MGVGAVAAVLTRLLLLEVLANLRLVVVVWNVKHYVLDYHRPVQNSDTHAQGSDKHFHAGKKARNAHPKTALVFAV